MRGSAADERETVWIVAELALREIERADRGGRAVLCPRFLDRCARVEAWLDWADAQPVDSSIPAALPSR